MIRHRAIRHRAHARLAALALWATSLSTHALASATTIGRTWPIAEPDALTEIEGRVDRQPASMTAAFGPRARWTAMRAAALASTSKDRIRWIVPFYTLQQDIVLPDGKLLYPRGFTFNPLSYVSLPQRLIVVAPHDLGWALTAAGPTDYILLTAGGPKDEDAIALGERHGRPLFILEERVKERLGLTVAPVIVRQVGQKLELTEIRLDQTATRRAVS
jgi:conjugal transfer pilus assembly protein TraW